MELFIIYIMLNIMQLVLVPSSEEYLLDCLSIEGSEYQSKVKDIVASCSNKDKSIIYSPTLWNYKNLWE